MNTLPRWKTQKLTAEQAAQIKRRILDGARTVDLAAEFGVSKVSIQNIKNGTRWRSVAPAAREDRP